MAPSTRSIPELLQATESFVEAYMQQYDSSHDSQHIRRVVRLADRLAAAEASRTGRKLNMTVVRLAALLHDVGDAKYAAPDAASDPVRRFLVSAGAEPALAAAVQTVTERVSFSKEAKDPEGVRRVLASHPELGPVQDADRLDALGAIGIGRCFTYGAANEERRRAKFLGTAGNGDGRGMEGCVAHFDEKLLRLQGMMKTPLGEQLARERTQRLQVFQRWWYEEQEGALKDEFE